MRHLGIDDIVKFVFVSSPDIEESEGKVAYLASKANPKDNIYESSVWIAEGPGEYYPVTRGPSDYCPKWSPDGSLISFTSRRDVKEGERGSAVYIIKPGRGEAWKLAYMKFGVTSIEWLPDMKGIVALSRSPAGDDVKWVDYKDRPVLEAERIPLWFNGEGWIFDRFYHLYMITYPGGEVIRLTGGERNVIAYAVADGRVVYAESYDMLQPMVHRLRVLDLETGEDSVVVEGYTISAVAVSPDGSRIAFRGHRRERGLPTHHRIYVTDLEGSVDCLTCSQDLSTINSVNSDVRGPSCTKQLHWAGDYIYYPLHAAGRVSVYRIKLGSEPEEYIASGDGVIDEFTVTGDGKVAYTYMTPTEPKELYARVDGEPIRLTDHNRGLRESRKFIEPKAYTVERGGYKVDYWILKKEGEDSCTRCKPWILYIHGGPKTSYGYAFIHELQTLAAEGFTVIYSNPRGSDGYSEGFADLRGRYGEDDYQDLMAVVDDALSKNQDLDPGRGGVTGGSYGGWMTNWIITQTDRFRAAVTQRSCSNWITFYGVSDIGWYFAPDQHKAGTPWETPERYIEKSPLFMVDKINTPLLIIHASEDYRCPLEQAIQLFTALKVRGVEVKIAIFPGENHDLSRRGKPKQRIERLKQIHSWFKKHLKEGSSPK